MIVINCQTREQSGASERAMVGALREQPGVLLVNALAVTGRRAREIDGIWLHPSGIHTIEVKGTRQDGELAVRANGAWTVGDDPADFPSGPNPTLQARQAAQALRGAATAFGVGTGFVNVAVAISGDRVIVDPARIGAINVVHVLDLPELLNLARPSALGAGDVLAVLAALDLPEADWPSVAALRAEGFADGVLLPPPDHEHDREQGHERSAHVTGATDTPRPGPGPDRDAGHDGNDGHSGRGRERRGEHGGSGRDARRARRLSDLTARARHDWRAAHRARLVASALSVPVLAVLVSAIPFYCSLWGLLVLVVCALGQLERRRRLSGRRDRGVLAVALWLVTLAPFFGIGASLSWIAAWPKVPTEQRPFVAMLGILIAAGVACAVKAGRSAFIYPPAQVIERYDDKGRPTGAFMLAHATPARGEQHDWRPVDDPAEDDAQPHATA